MYKTPAIISNLKIIGLKYIAMVEDGGEFGYKGLDLDNQIDHDDDDEEQEVDTTHPFQPGAASTPYQPGDPYHGGKQMEMRTMLHKQSGLPDTSYEEIPLLRTEGDQQRSWDSLTKVFPNASAINLETEYRKSELNFKMKGFGKKLYKLFTKD